MRLLEAKRLKLTVRRALKRKNFRIKEYRAADHQK